MSHRARPWVLGFSTGHNAAMCLLHGEEVVVAIQEERLSRQKRAGFIGTHCCALPYCLETAGISIEDLDLIVGASSNDYSLHPTLGFEGSRCEIEIIPHYLAHAHAAFASSGFDDAAILVVDGGGEFVGSLRAKFPEELAGARFADIPPVPEGRGEEPCEIVGLYHGRGLSSPWWRSTSASSRSRWARCPASGVSAGCSPQWLSSCSATPSKQDR